jgi:protein SCO1/2
MDYNLKTLVGLSLILAGLVVFGAGCQTFSSGYSYNGAQLDPPWPLPDFELTDTQGQTFRLSDVEADLALIYFGYTHCPDVCPLTLLDVEEALKGMDGNERVQVIFITLDPERDTPEVLAGYLSAFDPDFIGLTGDSHTIQEVIKPYRVVAEHEEAGRAAAGYLVNHTARLYLVNPQRELQLTYAFGFDPADLRSDLEHLLKSTTTDWKGGS